MSLPSLSKRQFLEVLEDAELLCTVISDNGTDMIILPQANAITTFVGALEIAELLCSIVSGVIILPQVPLQLLQQCHHVIVEEHYGAKEAHLVPIKACHGVQHGSVEDHHGRRGCSPWSHGGRPWRRGSLHSARFLVYVWSQVHLKQNN
jgi:hypothetical protein